MSLMKRMANILKEDLKRKANENEEILPPIDWDKVKNWYKKDVDDEGKYFVVRKKGNVDLVEDYEWNQERYLNSFFEEKYSLTSVWVGDKHLNLYFDRKQAINKFLNAENYQDPEDYEIDVYLLANGEVDGEEIMNSNIDVIVIDPKVNSSNNRDGFDLDLANEIKSML